MVCMWYNIGGSLNHIRGVRYRIGRMWYHLRGMLPSNRGLWHKTGGKWIPICARWIGTGLFL